MKHPSITSARAHAKAGERSPSGKLDCVSCSEYTKHGTLSGYTNWRCRCKECTEGSLKEREKYYEDNKEHFVTYRANRYQDFREWWHAQKIGKSCCDCAMECAADNYFVFDWDHRPEENKVFSLGSATRVCRNKTKLLAEITKCDLVCSNCHRMRTHARGQYAWSVT